MGLSKYSTTCKNTPILHAKTSNKIYYPTLLVSHCTEKNETNTNIPRYCTFFLGGGGGRYVSCVGVCVHCSSSGAAFFRSVNSTP